VSEPRILDPAEVEAIARRYTTTQIAELAAGYEWMRAKLAEAEVTIGKQSDLLSKRSERPAGRRSGTVHV